MKFIALCLFLTVLISGLSSALLLDSDYPDGRVAQWKFEGNLQDSIGDNHAISHEVGFRPGIIGGQAGYFDGNDFAEIPDDESLQFTDGMTIWGWIMPEQPEGPWAGIFSKGEAVNSSYYRVSRVYISNTTTNQFRTRWQFTDGNNIQANSAEGFIEYPVHGKIYNFAVTYDGGNVRLYLNGELVETTPYTEDLSLEGSAYIGAFKPVFNSATSSMWHFKGIIDEITLWGRALDANEIKRLYDLASDNTAPGQVTNLRETERTDSKIRWEWTNPADEDFSHNVIFIDGARVAEVSGNFYEARGLDDDTEYTIEIRTQDRNNNINADGVMDTASTREEKDDDGSRRDRPIIFSEPLNVEQPVIVQGISEGPLMLNDAAEPRQDESYLLVLNMILLVALTAILLLILLVILLRR